MLPNEENKTKMCCYLNLGNKYPHILREILKKYNTKMCGYINLGKYPQISKSKKLKYELNIDLLALDR